MPSTGVEELRAMGIHIARAPVGPSKKGVPNNGFEADPSDIVINAKEPDVTLYDNVVSKDIYNLSDMLWEPVQVFQAVINNIAGCLIMEIYHCLMFIWILKEGIQRAFRRKNQGTIGKRLEKSVRAKPVAAPRTSNGEQSSHQKVRYVPQYSTYLHSSF